MPNTYLYSYSQRFSKAINKALTGFVPASLMLTFLETCSSVFDSKELSRGIFATFTVLFNRLFEGNAKHGYDEKTLEAFYLAEKSGCTLEGAKIYLGNTSGTLEGNDKTKIKEFLVQQEVLSKEEKEPLIEKPKLGCLKSLIAKAADYDLFSAFASGVICYFMPVPTASPILSKVFTSSVASGTNYLMSWLSGNKNCCKTESKNEHSSSLEVNNVI